MTKSLDDLRLEIDALDDKIVALLAERFNIASQVAELKRTRGMAVRLQDRISEVLDRSENLAKQNGAEPKSIRAIYEAVIETTCRFEEARIGNS